MLCLEHLGFSNLIVDSVPLAQLAMEEKHMAIFFLIIHLVQVGSVRILQFFYRQKETMLLQREVASAGCDGDYADP